jgi:NADH:ubiquinone oxidoreductase subunit K
MTPLQITVIGVLGLIGIGLYGLLITRNLIKVVVALQVLVKGALLALVAAGTASGKINLGQSLAVMVIVVDTVVAVIALALALQVKRRMGTLDVKELATLKK